MNGTQELQQLPNPVAANGVPSFEASDLTSEIPEVEEVLANTAEAIEDAQELQNDVRTGLGRLFMKRMLLDRCVC